MAKYVKICNQNQIGKKIEYSSFYYRESLETNIYRLPKLVYQASVNICIYI